MDDQQDTIIEFLAAILIRLLRLVNIQIRKAKNVYLEILNYLTGQSITNIKPAVFTQSQGKDLFSTMLKIFHAAPKNNKRSRSLDLKAN